MSEDVRYSVLGPVRAWRGDEELELGSPQQRTVLAVLLLHEGRAATADTLISAVWGDESPRTAMLTLRTYVFRLRKVLGESAIRTVAGGYALSLEPDALDAAVHARAVARARGDVAALAEADALWQGDPLADIAGAWASRQRVRLQGQRQAAVRERIALDLAAGRAGAAVTELTGLVAAHPLDEELRGLLMTALAGSGRQALAVTQYHEIRTLLAHELGLDPSPDLQRAYHRLLNPARPASPDSGSLLSALPIESPPAAAHSPAARLVVPAQLPAPVRDFVGRADLLNRLSAVLTRDSTTTVPSASTGLPGAASIVGIVGIGGAGASALAVHVAHRIRPAFPDGQLYADLRGSDAGQVLAGFLRAFGITGDSIPADLTERAALWRSVADGRRILVVLDHATPQDQPDLLLPVTAGAAAIVTGGRRLPDLAVDEWATVPPFAPEESVQLLSFVIGAARVRAERAAALRLAEMCSHLPIAIRMGAERLHARPNWTLAETVERLRAELDHPVVVHGDCRRVYEPLERRLDEVHASAPRAVEAFELGTLLGEPEVALADVASLLGLPDIEAEHLLDDLVDAHLLEPVGFRRYRYLDALRRLAQRRLAARSATVGAQGAWL
ncbi:BTAD domain-containing putative transcriptional regulator [Paractinoplanes lichenicola]|uniref:Winged helix-turn-helix domain-containing protein n=1 Tax=Paractinoplanes lichenicola TaxID=2802976 RepID=A0ABS1VR31_9ACTN|nr:BTAD domain-containing putative transcriptional regulator [Actinoplanes lichenicola]MBL7257183.1 winged helix-turn-helix domain-containing protein [Actinoplanes lichenicola]